MKKLLTILALTATTFAADPTVHDEEMKELWAAWKEHHNKEYYEDEEPVRMKIFVNNHNKINAHNNAGNSTVTLGINQFADLTADEFQAQFTGGYVPQTGEPEEGRRLEGENKRFLGSLPASVDWRTKGAVTPVKNQKSCNGCWSFSTAGALEALHHIKTGSLVSFSEQQLIDCDKKSHGCTSGNMPSAYTYTAANGIEQESSYPLVDKNTACTYSSSKATKVNKGYANVKSRDATALMEALVSQPVSVALDSKSSVWQHYKSGVITSGCGSDLDHAVLAIGYTTVNGVKAFIVKNSWGTGWGENGYVYISASSSNVCGILSAPLYPTA